MAHIYNQEVRPVQLANGMRMHCVTSLLYTRQAGLWIAHGVMLSIIDRGTQIDYDLQREIGTGGAHALFEDRAGIIWIGTDQGLVRYDGEAFTRVSTGDLASRDVLFITEDRSGALWFGTTHGAGCLRDGSLTELTVADGLSPGRVRAILEDRSGTIWFGTYGGGLSRLKDGRLTRLSTEDGLIDNYISAIIEDDDDNLWISSNHGLSVVSRAMLEEVADGTIEHLNPVWYGAADGSAEANGGCQPAAWLDPSDGKLWFTTVDGLAVIDTAQRARNPLPPPVVIEEVVVDGARVAHQGGVRIHPGARDFEIGYSALSLLRPRHVRFKYRLLGYSDRWTDAGNRRTAYFTQVPPGDYRFQVIACNDDGIWNEKGAELTLVRLPRFSETPWFPLLIGLALVAGGFTVHKLRVRAMQLLNLELEQRVHERTAQLEEANQELETFAYSVSHDLRKPLRWIDGFGNILATSQADRLDGEGRELLSRIRAATRRMSALIDDLLTLSQVGRGELRREDIDIGHLAQEIIDEQRSAEPKRDVRISIATGLLVHADPRLVRIMLENLIGNAWKYTGQCRQAAIELGRQSLDDPVFFVRDNGVGFDMSHADKLFRPFQRLHSSEEFAGTGVGLATVQRIVARHHGRVWAKAEVGHGATFFFSLGKCPEPPTRS
jgi:signal transduction histidine kinase